MTDLVGKRQQHRNVVWLFAVVVLLSACGESPIDAPDATGQWQTAMAVVDSATAQTELRATQAANPTAQFETAVALVNAATTEAGLPATTTPAPTVQPTSQTGEPQLAPGQGFASIKTVCLQIDQSYPQIEEEFSLPIQETAEEILRDMGITVVEIGEACDATLDFEFEGKALSVTFENVGKCYNGAEITGQVMLSGLATDGRFPRSVSGEDPVPFLNYGCNPQPADAPWTRAWMGALLEGLTAIWGPQVLITFMDLQGSFDRSPADAVADTALKLETPQALDVLAHMLELDDLHKALAVQTLEQLGPEALPLLEGAASDSSNDVREAAVRALREFGVEAVPTLIEALDDEGTDVRKLAALSLGVIGPDALEAVPALIQRLNEDEDKWVRRAAAFALGGMGPDALEAVPALIQRLGEGENEDVRNNAAQALVAITGEDFGEDADAWQAWWDAQPAL